jgi:recombinational DNA repair protein RecT
MAKDPKLVLDNVIAAFSIARLPNGEQTFIVLPKWKLAKTWRETGAIDNPVNLKWPEEWFRKTAIRYHSKTLPKAVKLVTAVSLMNDHDGVKAKGKPESEFLKRIKKKGERQIDSEE